MSGFTGLIDVTVVVILLDLKYLFIYERNGDSLNAFMVDHEEFSFVNISDLVSLL